MISAGLGSPSKFTTWRVALRNVTDHRRRQDRWWCGVGLWLWLGRDGAVRGVVSLGAVTPDEFVAVLDRRWPTSMRSIEITAVREEVWWASRPGVIADTGRKSGRYQAVRMAVEPQQPRMLAPSKPVFIPTFWTDAMPVIL